MKVRFYKARFGDAIHIITNNGKNIFVDMGFSDTYENILKTQIHKINSENQSIDLLLISHIDNDHISGAIKFLNDIDKNVFDKRIIKEIWHNSYRNLNFDKEKTIDKEDLCKMKEIKSTLSTLCESDSSGYCNKKISAYQGSTLASLIYKLNIPWNESSKSENEVIMKKSIFDFDSFKLFVLTPTQNALDKLKRLWRNYLYKEKIFKFSETEIFDDAYEFYLLNEENKEESKTSQISNKILNFKDLLSNNIENEFKEDKSITNASSISILLIADNKKILLTGDANDKDLFNSLKELSDSGEKLEFDLVKLSHHGSFGNNYKWLKLIESKYYVISTDGTKFGHPDLPTIANLIKSQEYNSKMICFNYEIDLINNISDVDLMKDYNYDIQSQNQEWGYEIEL